MRCCWQSRCPAQGRAAHPVPGLISNTMQTSTAFTVDGLCNSTHPGRLSIKDVFGRGCMSSGGGGGRCLPRALGLPYAFQAAAVTEALFGLAMFLASGIMAKRIASSSISCPPTRGDVSYTTCNWLRVSQMLNSKSACAQHAAPHCGLHAWASERLSM